MSYEISVVIVQYNPNWESVKRTLMSILLQKSCKYEIVIADDGSKEDYIDRSEALLKQKGFVDYKIKKNINNQGTVKNVLSGIEIATGKYVRVIAPGDYLYSDRTLQKIVQFMNENNAKEMFGKLAGYYQEKDDFKVFKCLFPSQTELYQKKKSLKRLQKSLLAYGDNISGASYSWEREYYVSCLKKIENKVIFLEDCVNAYTLLENNRIYFLDEYVTWYEYGTGVTTGGNDKWMEKISKDWMNFFSVLSQEYGDNHLVKRAKMLHIIESRKDIFSKIKLRIVFLDKFISIKYRRLKDKFMEKENPDIEKLLVIYNGNCV